MQQPPEEVARRRKSADLDRREAEIAKREKAEADAQDAAAANERAKQYHEEFTAALKARGMPASKWALARMANAMRYALRNGIEADATWAAEAVEGEYAAERQEWTQSLQNLEGEALLSALGEPLYRKISAALVAKIRAQQATGAAPKAGAAPTPKAAAKPAPKSTEQLRAEWEEPTHKRA
jgi:hypothetical protein